MIPGLGQQVFNRRGDAVWVEHDWPERMRMVPQVLEAAAPTLHMIQAEDLIVFLAVNGYGVYEVWSREPYLQLKIQSSLFVAPQTPEMAGEKLPLVQGQAS